MRDNQPILTLSIDHDSACSLVKLCLFEGGFRAESCFDMSSACASFSEGSCPHHPNQPCACRLSTLIIFGNNLLAIPLIFHSDGTRTEIFYEEETPIASQIVLILDQVKRDEQRFYRHLNG